MVIVEMGDRVVDGMMMPRPAVVHRDFAAAVLVAVETGRIFVGQGRRGHCREQSRAGGGDQ
jgi:hypothetical protein